MAEKELIIDHRRFAATKTATLAGLALTTAALGAFALTRGAYPVPAWRAALALVGEGAEVVQTVVWDVRLPRIAAAIVVGWAMGLSGAVIQVALRNPLASPFTLGISHGAAFGAAFAVVVVGVGTAAAPMVGVRGVCVISACAFVGALATTVVIVALSKMKRMTPGSIVLAGVAISSLFASGTALLQYFASERQLAAVVFWTFGDATRSCWSEIGLVAFATLASTLVFAFDNWNFTLLSAGDETATSLGLSVGRFRLKVMTLAALMAALAVAFHGVIAFLGLLAPHIARRIVGEDHRFLGTCSALVGALLLLAADTAGRLVTGAGTLPVGVITSFMGAPLFLYLLISRRDLNA